MVNIPEPKKVLKELIDLLLIIYSSLDYGTFKTLEFFEGEKKGIERFLAPNLVRYYTKEALRKDQVAGFKIENVPNNGLFVGDNNYNIRILKSNKDQLPVPGHSMARQLFYQQIGPQLPLFPGLVEEKVNLIVLWEVNNTYKMAGLSLACPKEGGTSRDSVVAYWHFGISHKTLLKIKDNTIDLSSADIKDLPLTFALDNEIEEEV